MRIFYKILYNFFLTILKHCNNSYKKGIFAEQVAKYYLQSYGFKHLSSRFKLSYAEIDLIMQHKNQLIGVEVKYRANKKDLADIISPTKVDKLSKALTAFQQKNLLNNKDLRIDIILIANNYIEWIKNVD